MVVSIPLYICLQGYKPIDGIPEEAWEETDDDLLYEREKGQYPQNDAEKKGGSQQPKGKPIPTAVSEYVKSAIVNKNSHNIYEIGYDTEKRLQTGTDNVSKDLRECKNVSPNELKHANKQQAPSMKVSDLSCQDSLPNDDTVDKVGKNYDAKREQELKQTGGYKEGENTSTKQELLRSQNFSGGGNEDITSNMTDEEILEKYRERNRYRRWSQPSWRMSLDGPSTSRPLSERIGNENELLENRNAKTDTDIAWRDGMETKSKEHKLTAAKLVDGTQRVEIDYSKEGTEVHPNENASNNVVLRKDKSDENEDMNKPGKELRQQWSISKRKSTQGGWLEGDENLSRVGQQKEESKMEIEMPHVRDMGVDNSIMYFNYRTDAREKLSDYGKCSESVSPTDFKHDDTGKGCQQSFAGYDDDIDYDTLTDDFHYSGTESSSDILTTKTDEMLQGS